MIQLYHNDMSSCAQKVRIVLAEKGLEWEGHHLSLRDGESRTSEYKKLNPNGVVPTLITDNNEMLDLLRKGQAVFGISLGPVHTETEAEIFSLYPEKISAINE